jgi:hypothetical protein
MLGLTKSAFSATINPAQLIFQITLDSPNLRCTDDSGNLKECITQSKTLVTVYRAQNLSNPKITSEYFVGESFDIIKGFFDTFRETIKPDIIAETQYTLSHEIPGKFSI